MERANCKLCELALNRKGEGRPGIRCKSCKLQHCYKCAELTVQFCEMAKLMEKDVWCCGECEGKTAVMKTVLDKIETLHTEMVVIKKGQEGQQIEQERVLEGIKVVETVVKRMESIEKTQADQGERLLEQEASTRKINDKIQETDERTTAIEKRLAEIDSDAVSVRQTNAIIREMRQLEREEKNLVISNLPESIENEAEERKKEDEKRVSAVLAELKNEQIKPTNVIRIGRGNPRKLLVIFRTTDECKRILQSAEKATLQNDVWLSRARTWNEREEARLFREEKGKEEAEGAAPPQRGRPRGSGKGPGPSKTGNGSVRGRSSRQDESGSRKRQRSGEEDNSKWRRTGENGRGGRGRGGRGGRGRGRGATRGRGAEDGGPEGERQTNNNGSPSADPTLPICPTATNVQPNVQPNSDLATPEASTSQLQRTAVSPGMPLRSTGTTLGATDDQVENF